MTMQGIQHVGNEAQSVPETHMKSLEGRTLSLSCGHVSDGRWRKRVWELLAPWIPFCRGFLYLETFSSLCLWFPRRDLSFSLYYLVFQFLQPRGERSCSLSVNPVSQTGWIPLKEHSVYLISGASPPAKLEPCRIEDDRLTPNLLWGLGHQQKRGTLNVSFFPTLSTPTPSHKCRACQDARRMLNSQAWSSGSKIPLCCKFFKKAS